jgi:hypothetical protein
MRVDGREFRVESRDRRAARPSTWSGRSYAAKRLTFGRGLRLASHRS